jgi:hypothetical protein
MVWPMQATPSPHEISHLVPLLAIQALMLFNWFKALEERLEPVEQHFRNFDMIHDKINPKMAEKDSNWDFG